MKTKQETIDELVASFKKTRFDGLLDEEVQNMKLDEGSDINNGGLKAQIEYILSGYPDDQIEQGKARIREIMEEAGEP